MEVTDANNYLPDHLIFSYADLTKLIKNSIKGDKRKSRKEKEEIQQMLKNAYSKCASICFLNSP